MSEPKKCPVVGRQQPDVTQAGASVPTPSQAPIIEHPIKLNLGSGSTMLPGFTNIDRHLGLEVFPLSFATECVEEIRASHVLEHFPKGQTLEVLREWVRVLKPGGSIQIAVPNFEYALEHLDHPHAEGWIFGGQTDDNDYHHAAFTEEKLRTLMEECGLVEIFPWVSTINDCASLPVSLNLMGRKPGPVAPLDPKAVRCVGVLSAPRLQFGDLQGCADAVQAAFGYRTIDNRGAFWEQCLQNLFEEVIGKGFDIAFTRDYDTAFTPAHFAELLKYLVDHPEVDAVAPMQPMRGAPNRPLMVPIEMKDGQQGDFSLKTNEPVVAFTAHFGLTFFRLSSLKQIPLPWFQSFPGKTGRWTNEDGKLDADMYFWKKFNEHGKVLHVLPWVQVGHLETVVSFFDVQKTGLQQKTMLTKDWRNQIFNK